MIGRARMNVYPMLNEPLQPGDVLQDRYTITRLHRLSGMSALYEAQPLNGLDGYLAIKEAIVQDSDDMLAYDPLREFEQVGAALLKASHPVVTAVHDYFIEEERTYLVTEFVNGNDLETTLNQAKDRIPVETVHLWAVSLAEAIHHLHSLTPFGVIYRDLKPANLMLDQNGLIRLVDFGIAVIRTSPPRIHPPLGTDGYAAPEQYVGETHPAIDIYGLGATLHHLLTGSDPRLEPPFSFDKRPIKQYNPAVPPALIEVVETAVAYNSWERYQTMAEMLAALQQIGPLPDN